ncbi:MAG: methyltransferase domain-containing protein [Streptosporangiaceae bacterium]
MTGAGEPRAQVTPGWARALRDAGELAPQWEAVFQQVPRHLFLPNLVWPFDREHGQYGAIDRTVSPPDWYRSANADVAIVTQWDDGRHIGLEPGETPTSSSSEPTLVARMLADLNVRPGQRVLDLGTGTGWTSALLATRLGQESVVGVEVDPAVAEAARARLRAAGLAPLIVTGEGDDGWAPGAPYDRLHAAFAVHDIPRAWVEQTRPGGSIVVPWATPFTHTGAIARLTVHADGSASGTFTRPAEFMLSRSRRSAWPDHSDYVRPGSWPADTSESVTALRPQDLWDSPEGTGEFVVGLMVPRAVHTTGYDAAGTLVAWFYSLNCRSWAVVCFRPEGLGRSEVYQGGGDRRLWDEVENAYRWWEHRGRPRCRRFGLTVDPGGRATVWLDRPEQPLPIFL